jgi:hypothetical protein
LEIRGITGTAYQFAEFAAVAGNEDGVCGSTRLDRLSHAFRYRAPPVCVQVSAGRTGPPRRRSNLGAEALTEPSGLDSVASDTRAALETALFHFGCETSVAAGKRACVAKLARFAGENNMPALFGYLVALTLLLGGGYAGLQWLASPDDAGTQQRIGEKPTARNVPKKSEVKSELKSEVKSEFNGARATAVPGEADGASEIGTTASATPDREAPHQSGHEANETEKISKAGDPTPGVNNDNAPAGGCMPIGVTAHGADVFPIQCQAWIERQRGSVPSSAPPPTAAASGAVQAAELAKPSDSGAAMTRPAQPDPPNKRQDKRNARSARSRLVMMYLRTIEFPDGHREQQLLPIRRSRRTAVQTEDQW